MRNKIKYAIALAITVFLFNNKASFAQSNEHKGLFLKINITSNISVCTEIESILYFYIETNEKVSEKGRLINDENNLEKAIFYDIYGRQIEQLKNNIKVLQLNNQVDLIKTNPIISIENPYRIISKKIHLG